MNQRQCVYCGQVIAGADYHVVGIGQDRANLVACVGCWRVHGMYTEARETGASHHKGQNLGQAGLWAVLAALAILTSATGLCGLVV